MKTKKPPSLGTRVRISLTLPSGSTVELAGQVSEILGPDGMGGRGPGIDIALRKLPQSVLWLIESALASAGFPPSTTNVEVTESSAPVEQARPEPAPPQELSDASLEDGDELVEAEADLVQALWTELNGMSKMNPFQRLDLSYQASDKDVRVAFGALSKKYHPDRFTRYESFELRELANEVFILLRDAYRKVADEAGRHKELRKVDPALLRRASPPPIPKNPPPGPAARSAAEPSPGPRPVSPIGDDAPTHNRGAAMASPPDPAHPLSGSAPIGSDALNKPALPARNRTALGLGILESGNYEHALRILRVESRKNPSDTQARAGIELAEGRLALTQGDRMEAAQRFEAALEIDPSNERAAREIAEMRRHATSQRRGLLSKLMKKA